jgi:hypothetical protein
VFLELHLLQNFAPSCLNRDDTNAPKDAEFGGYRRARISRQVGVLLPVFGECCTVARARGVSPSPGLPRGARSAPARPAPAAASGRVPRRRG